MQGGLPFQLALMRVLSTQIKFTTGAGIKSAFAGVKLY